MGLRRFRIGNDLTVFWAINNRDGSPFDLEGRDVRLYMTHDKGREEVKAIISRLQDGTINNVIRWDFAGAEQRFLGEYKLTAEISESATKRVITKDHCEAFTLVSRSEMEDESLEANISIGGDLIISSRLDIYRFEAVPVDVSALKVQMHEIQNDIEEINNDVGDINDDITNINKDIRTLRDAIQNFTPEIPDIDLSDYYTKKEIDVKVTTINNRIAIFEEWFKDDGNGNIKTTYDFYSTKTLAAGAVGSAGSGEGDGGGGSVNAISVDGVVYSPTDGIIDLSRAFANVKVDLSDYYTKGEVDGKISSIDFTPYLTKDAASNTYATKSDLSSLQGEVDNIESVLGLSESASGYINTWNEVVAFLDGYSQSDDLATILSGINGNVTTLQGYFTEGIANKATADSSGNVITSTYAKQSTSIIAGSGLTGGGTLAADRTINVVSANDGITVNADNIQLNTVNTLTSTSTNKPLSAAQGKALSERIAVFEEWFKDDGSGNIKTTYNFYSTKAIAAGGAGEEGGGGTGGVTLLTSWNNIPSDLGGYALGATLGVDLNTRVTTLEGKATAVSFSQTLTSGTAIGTITIDGTSKVLYAPSKLSQFTDDVVAGKYLPLSGGTIRGGVLEIDSSLGAYSFLRFKDRRINSAGYADNILKIIDADGNAHGALGLYGDSNGVLYYYLGCENDSYNGNNLRIYADKVSFGGSTILHSGNIGEYKAGDSDKLGGYGTNRFLLMTGRDYDEMDLNTLGGSQSVFTEIRTSEVTTTNAPHSGYGALLSLKDRSGIAKMQFLGSFNSSVLYFRSQQSASASITSAWKTIAFTDSDITGNADSATRSRYVETLNYTGAGWYGDSYKLYAQWFNGIICDWKSTDDANNQYKVRVDIAKKLDTSRTIWGQSFDGTGDVNGAIRYTNGLSFIDPSDNNVIFGYDYAQNNKSIYIDGAELYFRYSSAHRIGLIFNSSGNVTIGASDLAGTNYALNVGNLVSIQKTTNPAPHLKIASVGSTINYIHMYVDTNNTTTGRALVLQKGYGNVGIGCEPTYKLHVDGTIYASGAATLASTLSVTGATTLSDALTLANNKAIKYLNNAGTGIVAMHLDADNNFLVGFGVASAGYNTYIDGYNIHFRYSKSRVGGMTLNSSGALSIAGATTISNTLTVSKDISTTGILKFNGGYKIQSYNNTPLSINAEGNNVLIGTTTDYGWRLLVSGSFNATGKASLGGTVDVSGLLTANAGIKIAAGQSITFLDSAGDSHTLSYDSANKAFKFAGSMYATGQIAAGAVAEVGSSNEGGGSGSSVSFSKTLTSGTAIGTLTIDGTSQVLYAPNPTTSLAWSAITSKPTTISGYGITDAVSLTGSQALVNKTYNGYTLGAACAYNVTTSVSSGSTSLVTSGAVFTALQALSNNSSGGLGEEIPLELINGTGGAIPNNSVIICSSAATLDFRNVVPELPDKPCIVYLMKGASVTVSVPVFNSSGIGLVTATGAATTSTTQLNLYNGLTLIWVPSFGGWKAYVSNA